MPISFQPAEIDAIETDLLVLGGGLSGFRAAVAARETGCTVAHAYLARGASPYIIGANVPLGHADPADDPECYAADMIAGGYGLSDRRLVHALAHHAVASFEDMVRLGVPFARGERGFLQRHLSGNTWPRSVYVPEGIGKVALEHLAARASTIGVQALAGRRVVALLGDGGEVVGALLADRRTQRFTAVHARAVILAMGGIGRLYADSTYPSDVAADAYALALEAGARLIDMEFVQFEPLVTVHPAGCRGMEMPTAMLGDGAPLLDAAGERFMFRYNPEHGERQIEKARLSLCIQQEIDGGRGFADGSVLLDTTTLPRDTLESYVAHCKRLRGAGLEPSAEGPRVRPAAHSEMGGVFIDATGATETPGLFACGEASGGIHGASRLAGNGGGETMAMGWLVGRAAARALAQGPQPAARDWRTIHAAAFARLAGGDGGTGTAAEIKEAIRASMGAAAGLYRTGPGLGAGLRELEDLARHAAGLPANDMESALEARSARNMALVAGLILRAALARTESRGAHQRRDHPRQDDERWARHLAFRLTPEGMVTMDTLPIH
ncbi:FAD-binding protein [Marinimicrococcus flavescens]|uniref:FAD-binding protein n=1 Tax=Marinimicrococcus flavescens TaxID=3031815 RepID=A0AAP3XS06_9PROT|nr:FAD-binding protein [Marinimicrococcus flavescens]